jgi:hypothetical protein
MQNQWIQNAALLTVKADVSYSCRSAVKGYEIKRRLLELNSLYWFQYKCVEYRWVMYVCNRAGDTTNICCNYVSITLICRPGYNLTCVINKTFYFGVDDFWETPFNVLIQDTVKLVNNLHGAVPLLRGCSINSTSYRVYGNRSFITMFKMVNHRTYPEPEPRNPIILS